MIIKPSRSPGGSGYCTCVNPIQAGRVNFSLLITHYVKAPAIHIIATSSFLHKNLWDNLRRNIKKYFHIFNGKGKHFLTSIFRVFLNLNPIY